MVFINGVNIGRYWSAGPQRTLYVPAPILKSGLNRVWGGGGGGCAGSEPRPLPSLAGHHI